MGSTDTKSPNLDKNTGVITPRRIAWSRSETGGLVAGSGSVLVYQPSGSVLVQIQTPFTPEDLRNAWEAMTEEEREESGLVKK